MKDVGELLERVKRATGADRQIDYDLYAMLRGFEWQKLPRRRTLAGVYPDGKIAYYHQDSTPRLTASIDAALALLERVLPGWSWNVGNLGEDDCPAGLLTEPEGECRDFVGSAATAPLAILLALLLALSATEHP